MLRTVLSFLTRPASQSRQLNPNGSMFAWHFTTAECTGKKNYFQKENLNFRYLRSSICICESAKTAAKHIIFLSSSRFITKTLWIETLMNTLKTSRKWKKQLLNTHLAYFSPSRGLSRRGKNFGFVVRDLYLHPEIYSKSKCVLRDVIVQEQIPQIISKTNRLHMLLILHPTNFGFFPLL